FIGGITGDLQSRGNLREAFEVDFMTDGPSKALIDQFLGEFDLHCSLSRNGREGLSLCSIVDGGVVTPNEFLCGLESFTLELLQLLHEQTQEDKAFPHGIQTVLE